MKLYTFVVHYLQMCMKEFRCCLKFRRGDDSTYMKLYYPVCIENNRQMEMYSPGCMDNKRQMKLYYPVCVENNRQMEVYSPWCMDSFICLLLSIHQGPAGEYSSICLLFSMHTPRGIQLHFLVIVYTRRGIQLHLSALGV
jgi:hypothetical protein